MDVLRRAAALALLVPALLATSPLLAVEAAEEYALKAAFLLNFTRFVEWPAGAFTAGDEPLRLCVLGHDPFGDALEQVLAGETVGGRRIEPRRLRSPREEDDDGGCHLLFLSAEEDADLLDDLPDDRRRRRLTVGETDEFLEHGGLLRFRLRSGRIRLEVNGDALAETELRVSSKLLRLADLVRPGTGR